MILKIKYMKFRNMCWFEERAIELFSVGLYPKRESESWKRNFKEHFGVSVAIIKQLWNGIIDKHPKTIFQQEYLMWTLFFLQNAPTEGVACGFFKIGSRTTWRKWIWIGVALIASLEYVYS